MTLLRSVTQCRGLREWWTAGRHLKMQWWKGHENRSAKDVDVFLPCEPVLVYIITYKYIYMYIFSLSDVFSYGYGMSLRNTYSWLQDLQGRGQNHPSAHPEIARIGYSYPQLLWQEVLTHSQSPKVYVCCLISNIQTVCAVCASRTGESKIVLSGHESLVAL